MDREDGSSFDPLWQPSPRRVPSKIRSLSSIDRGGCEPDGFPIDSDKENEETHGGTGERGVDRTRHDAHHVRRDVHDEGDDTTDRNQDACDRPRSWKEWNRQENVEEPETRAQERAATRRTGGRDGKHRIVAT